MHPSNPPGRQPLNERLALLLSIAGAALVITQIILQLLEGSGICFNDSCKLVEEQTRIAPLLINLAGLAFFALSALLLTPPLRSDAGATLLGLLLLAGIAAEGVLFGFQHFVLQAYCSYCLIVLSCIIVLNLLAGWSQALRAVLVFSSVLLVLSLLNFTGPSDDLSMDRGTMASLGSSDQGARAYLVFSSSCGHCENVLAAMDDAENLAIGFNPIDRINTLPIAGIRYHDEYNPEVNRRILNALGIEEIPVLIARTAAGFEILTGETAILDFIGGAAASSGPQHTELPASSYSPAPLIPGLTPDADGCSVSADCAEPAQPQ